MFKYLDAVERKVLHRFPAKDENACKIWTYRCYRKGIFNIRPARICYKHFEDSCYERDLRNELLGLPCRLMLRPGSLPTCNLLNVSSITTPNRERTARAHTRSIRSLRLKVLEGAHSGKKEETTPPPPPKKDSEKMRLIRLQCNEISKLKAQVRLWKKIHFRVKMTKVAQE